MDENLILIVDYEKICRLCLRSTGVMSNIFENNNESSLKELIYLSTGLNVEKGDILPTNICHKCLYIVELCYELRNMVTKTHKLLTEAVDKNLGTTLNTSHKPLNNSNIKLVMQPDGKLTLVTQDHRNEDDTDYIEDYEDMKFEYTGDDEFSVLEQKTTKGNNHVSTERVRKAAPKHLTCQICLSAFPNSQQVRAHALTHYADTELTPYLDLQRPYTCEVCNDGNVSKKQLIVHHRKHLDVNPFICKHPGCTFIGKNKDSLRHHTIVHGSRSLVCERCGAAFRRRWELRQHAARAHAPADTRRCAECGRVFRNVFTYRAHLNTHKRPPRFACTWRGCPKAYHTRGALAAHARAHAGQRVFRCRLCSVAAYTSQSLLNRHMRMHGRARVSRCDKCEATFAEYGAFYRHRVTHHGPWMPHRCAGCGRSYQSETQLEKHVQRCELAVGMRSCTDGAEQDADDVTNGEQHVTNEHGLDPLKGRSLLIQPMSMHEIKDSAAFQELPADGLLYIEVQPDAACENNQQWN